MNSYTKLKIKYTQLWKVYVRAIKRLKNLGEGLHSDDFLIGDEINYEQ